MVSISTIRKSGFPISNIQLTPKQEIPLKIGTFAPAFAMNRDLKQPHNKANTVRYKFSSNTKLPIAFSPHKPSSRKWLAGLRFEKI